MHSCKPAKGRWRSDGARAFGVRVVAPVAELAVHAALSERSSQLAHLGWPTSTVREEQCRRRG